MSVLVTSPRPAWVVELDRALEPHRLAVLATPVVEHSAENTLAEQRMQDFLVSFYPIIRVERRHDAMWRAMADGFGVPKGRFRDALRLLGESAYDAIIVDMRMPDVSGEQLYDELCARDPEHAGRVIFTTGDVMNEQMRGFLASSGRPLIAKPFELPAFDQVPRRPAAAVTPQ